MLEELAKLDATAQAELVRRGEVKPLELVEAAIDRIEKVNPKLNAIITPLFEKARDQAARGKIPAGPFHGVPFVVKDIVCHTAGDPYHCGMRVLRDLGWTEPEDTILAARYRAAGFLFVGKSNLPELATCPTTEPLAYGPTRNPWNPQRTTGGSSGGSAAAVASGMVPVAHGNDMGGSIRIPASACGLVGLKPSRGRTTLGPDFGEFWWALTHEHVLARSVRDTAGVLDAVAGPAPGDPYTAPPFRRPLLEEIGASPGRLRIGFRSRLPGGEGEAHSDCRAAVEEAARLLESLGHDVSGGSPEALDEAEHLGAVLTVFSVAITREIDRWSARIGRTIGKEDIEPINWFSTEMGRRVSAAEYVAATETLERYSRKLCEWWTSGFDVLLTPTLGEPPPLLGTLSTTAAEPIEVMARWGRFAPFTVPFNVTGQPAISLPLHWNRDGLPIGVQLVAPYGREDLLVRLAAQLEQALPWSQRWPGVRA